MRSFVPLTRIVAWRKGLLPLNVICGVALLAAMMSCTADNYESGDTRYSYMRADFGLMHTSAPGWADYLAADDADTVRFAVPTPLDWAVKGDTLYRALVYYDVRNAQVYSVARVLVATPVVTQRPDTVESDPIAVESTWTAGGFFNIGFAVKTGQADGMAGAQSVGLMVDSVVQRPDGGGKEVCLRLIHRQNGQPEYYTVHGYLSTAVQPGCTYRLDK